MQLVLDRASNEPLHRQIEQQLRRLIDGGDLSAGTRLPASRVLARTLGVNRATVTTAYDALAAAGIVEPRVGHGTQVLPRRSGRRTSRPAHAAAADWSGLFSSAIGAAPRDGHDAPGAREPARIDLRGLVPDERLFPVQQLRRCMDIVLRRDGEALLQYGATRGWEPFIEVITQRMRLAGADIDRDHVLIVNGAQQGLDLFCTALLDPGDAVVVESPTYGNLLPLLRIHHAETIAVRMTDDGLDLDELESVLRRRRIKFLYTMPHFQNPTGVTSTLEHRKRLLQLAAEHDVAILEDGFEEDLRWDGGEVLPLHALDTHGRVCYVGTFSKGLCPGFRVGWLVAPPQLLAPLANLKRATDYHTSVVLQAALAEFCAQGAYDQHLRRLRRVYRSRMQATQRALEAHVPPSVRWRVPDGGYCVWLELPPGPSEDELVARLARDGVRVSPGRHFFTTDPGHGCLRLSISRSDIDEIETGIRILGQHVRTLLDVAPRTETSTTRPYI
jgi:DNA-binding transcriptional MocR family regulator